MDITNGSRYINPYTDYGFKYLFGTESQDVMSFVLNVALFEK